MRKLIILVTCLLFLVGASNTLGIDVRLAWDKESPEADLAGFKIYATEDGINYDPNNPAVEIFDPNARTAEVKGLDGTKTWHFVATCFDTWGNESDRSNEVTLWAILGPPCCVVDVISKNENFKSLLLLMMV